MSKYEVLTNRIIAALEQGVRPWQKEWNGGTSAFARPLRSDGTPYRGVNTLNLWLAKEERGFKSDYWFTYKKAQELGAQVKKGAKSESAFYVSSFKVEEQGTDARTVPFLKAYAVFNADEIEGLAAKFYGSEAPILTVAHNTRHEAAEAFIAATGAEVRHGGDRAFYTPKADFVQLPHFESFFTAEGYYSTAFHELAHWTGAEKRLNRTKGKFFGDSNYAFEELVAELSAAYLCADLGVTNIPRDDHAAYINHWIKCLKDDERAIFKAASLAEKAVGYLHGQEQEEQVAQAA